MDAVFTEMSLNSAQVTVTLASLLAQIVTRE